MSQKPLQIFFSENPLKKRNILQNSFNNNAPIIEQKLIIHHKRNLRKSMLYNSKNEFDKVQKQKEPKSDLNKNNNINGNKNDKKEDYINTDKRSIKFNDNLLMRKEDFLDEKEKKELEEKNKNKQKNKNGKAFNPFGILVDEFLEKNKEKPEINNNNTTSLNPFKNINYKTTEITNNPFTLPSQDKINKINPFMELLSNKNNNKDNKTQLNPFINAQNNSNQFNPFLIKDDKNSNNTKINNPFLKNDEGVSNKQTNNPFLLNNDGVNKGPSNNPFLINGSSNIFTFSSNNLKHDPSEIHEKQSDDEDKNNIEEEVKIEKDENKFKDLKEVQYQKKNKFFETEIENLQFLEQENGKNKYTSKGSGIFSFEEDKNEQGEKVGIFTLREKSTKNIKLKGIVINSTSVEKSQLKTGLEFIFIKDILVKYTKYYSMSEITKITFLRIRVKEDKVDDFYNKTNDFFNLVKK